MHCLDSVIKAFRDYNNKKYKILKYNQTYLTCYNLIAFKNYSFLKQFCIKVNLTSCYDYNRYKKLYKLLYGI